jgi:2-haloacid dehalogenase
MNAITHLTFDCYGTLIDWENGILQALQPLLQAHGADLSAQELLRLYVAHEASFEAKPWRPYRQILREISTCIACDLGVTLSNSEADILPDSISKWWPFPDSVSALNRLRERYPLVILSNIDDGLFAQTKKHLQVDFAEVITAEQLRSYKPAPAHFLEAMRRRQLKPSQILHVAQSLYHDHVPARRLGISTAWINRPSLLTNAGLSPAAEVQPDLTFPNLAALADWLDRSHP